MVGRDGGDEGHIDQPRERNVLFYEGSLVQGMAVGHFSDNGTHYKCCRTQVQSFPDVE